MRSTHLIWEGCFYVVTCVGKSLGARVNILFVISLALRRYPHASIDNLFASFWKIP